MTRWGRVVASSFAAWLMACSGERPGAQCPDCVTEKPPPHAPPLAPGVLVAPDGLRSEGAPCAQDAECSSKVCWLGFCGRPNPTFDGGGPGAIGEACARDADCQSVFCDLGRCAQPLGQVNYGIECEPRRPEPQVLPCGAYLCTDRRCRSCQSDAECNYWMGAEACRAVKDRPGKGCGASVETPVPATPAEPPSTTPEPPRP